jgi:hypothetical protein
MPDEPHQQTLLAAVILGACLLVGIVAGAYLVLTEKVTIFLGPRMAMVYKYKSCAEPYRSK